MSKRISFDRHAIKHVRIADLQIHPKVQKKLVANWARHIATNFDPDKFGVLTVVQHGDKLYVIDGQHRLVAMRDYLKVNSDQTVPCQIFPDEGTAKAAQRFLGLNDHRAVIALDKFIQRVNAGEATAVAIADVLKRNGLSVTASRGENIIHAVTALDYVYGKCGGSDGLNRVLALTKSAFGSQAESFDGHILRAVGAFLSVYKNEVDDAEMVSKLSKNGGPSHFIGKIKERSAMDKIDMVRAGCISLLREYNKKKRTGALKNVWTS